MTIDPTILLQPGILRHKITITVEDSNSRDAYGQPSSTWTTVLTTRARIEGTAGRDLVQNGVISSQVSEIITIRWPGANVDVKSGMHVQFGDNTYLIQAVDNVLRRNRVVKLYCLSIDGDTN